MPRRFLITIAALAMAAACGNASSGLADDTLVIVVSSDLSIGQQRVVIGALNPDNESVVADEPVSFEFFRPDGSAAGATSGSFIWAIPDVRALWVTSFDFDTVGTWTFGVRTSDDRLVAGVPFPVDENSIAIGNGTPAPESITKTAAGGSMAVISTDPDPDSRFYEMTVAEAVTSGRPSVIVFATPAFCTSATCGPSLDIAKSLIDDFPGTNWVHVEVFDNLEAATRDELVVVDAVTEWGLPTEPWVFVVDPEGIVIARFEGALGRDELASTLTSVQSG